MVKLPIAQYPQITPIQIQVTATYPGANGTLVAQNVGAPIEQQVNGANNMIYMSSTSSSTGNYTLTVYFTIDTDPALAQVDVQNRVSQAMAQLPQAVQAQGVTCSRRRSTFLMVLAFYSPDGRYDATTSPTTPTSRCSARSTASPAPTRRRSSACPITRCASGSSPTAWRSSASPRARSPTRSRTRTSSSRSAASAPRPRRIRCKQTFPVTTTTITEPSQFDNMILRAENPDAALVRVKDVGYADLGAQSYSLRTSYQGKPATLIAVYQQPGANAIQVSKDVRATLEELSKSFPDGLKYDVALDTTLFVQASIDEVIKTFFEAVVLVVLVVFVFLHSLRLTIIPTLAVPVSILGALVGMLVFGFSINMLTLFGMILAIGLVVDDAIVVVENTERNMVQFRPVAEGRRQARDGRGERPGHRRRAGAERRVHPGGVPRRHHRRAVQAVRRHHRHLGGVLRHRRAHALAGPRGDPDQGQARREEGLLQVVRRHVRSPHQRLRRRREVGHAPLGC